MKPSNVVTLSSHTDAPNTHDSSLQNAPHFTFEAFSGPLDLLLFLVQKHKIDIYDIPITEITDQYLLYLKEMVNLDLDDLTSFYRVASWLLLIKSRMLLPIQHNEDEEEIDTTRTELINTLIEYQKYRKLSNLLEERYEQFNWLSLRKDNNTLPLDIPQESMWKEVQALALFSTFFKLMNRPKIDQRIIDLNEQVTINEKIALIYETLDSQEECSFDDIVDKGSVLSVVCSILALLELMKSQQVVVIQHVLYEDIRILKKTP